MKALDSHTHAFATSQVRSRAMLVDRDPVFAEMYGDPRAAMATAGEVAAALERDGMAGGLVAGFAFSSLGDCDEANDALLCRPEAHALLSVMATVNPARPGWEAAARLALDRGAAGFGELRPGSQGWDPLGPRGLELCGLAEEADAILLWHVSERAGHTYPGKQGGIGAHELYELATRFPRVRHIAAHLGAELPFYFQMPEVAAALRNVWFDTAAASLLYDDRAVVRVIGLVGSDRVLFGSDYPLLTPRRHLMRIVATLDPEQAAQVCSGNLRELVGRPWTG